MSALRKTLMLFWILTLGMIAALKYLITTKLAFGRQKEKLQESHSDVAFSANGERQSEDAVSA